MKKKMRIILSKNSTDKCRKKAMQVAVVADGVTSVAIEGELMNELVVSGEGVDATCLVAALRKKACFATLETLVEVKPQPRVADQSVTQHYSIAQAPLVNYDQLRHVVYDPYGQTGCLVM